jgi:hypothetical protein
MRSDNVVLRGITTPLSFGDLGRPYQRDIVYEVSNPFPAMLFKVN